MSGPPFAMSKYASEADLLRDKCEWMTGLLRQIVAGWRQSGTAEVWAASALQIASEYVDGTRHQSGNEWVARCLHCDYSFRTDAPIEERMRMAREHDCPNARPQVCDEGDDELRSLRTLARKLAEWEKRWPKGTILPSTMERQCNDQLAVLCTLATVLSDSQSVACTKQEGARG